MSWVVRQMLEGVKLGVQLCCVCHCFTENVVEVVFCNGSSMEPTIEGKDLVIVDRRSVDGVKVGDVVIAASVTTPGVNVCKRILGADGQMVWTGSRWYAVPTGYVWLQGDNPQDSIDSRDYGPVPRALIRGRVLCKFWPNFGGVVSDKCPPLNEPSTHWSLPQPSS